MAQKIKARKNNGVNPSKEELLLELAVQKFRADLRKVEAEMNKNMNLIIKRVEKRQISKIKNNLN